MSVYVDLLKPCAPNSNWRYAASCHLFADSIEELMEFSGKIGLKPEWFQNHKLMPHFDLTPSMRQKAVQSGAIQLSLRDTAAFMMKRKAA